MAEKFGNRWQVVEKLGVGGQGEVFKVVLIDEKQASFEAIEEALNLLVQASNTKTRSQRAKEVTQLFRSLHDRNPPPMVGALKRLHPIENEAERKKTVARMRTEIEVYERFQDPHILRILDKDLVENWLVTDFEAHGPLSRHLRMFRGRVLESLNAIRPLVSAVALLHSEKLVHRDIKPANVFVRPSERSLVLGDAGLVFFQDSDKSRVTDTFENVGTRDYMPQWAMSQRIEDVRPTFDVFSLGKLLWSMIAGRPACRLWYVHKDEYELEKLFPHDPSILAVREILDCSVVEEEKDCFPNAKALLEVIDAAIRIVRNGAQPIHKTIVRLCTVCAFGSYKPISEPVHEDKEIRQQREGLDRFGLKPSGGTRHLMYACNHCGHVQIFYGGFVQGPEFGPLPTAWKKGGYR